MDSPTAAIVSMEEWSGIFITGTAAAIVIDDQIKAAIDAYYEQYGAQA